jgi:hypothetical protein
MPVDALSFRCSHRHTAESHPQCYKRYLEGDQSIYRIQVNRPRHQRSARILLIDIETLPGEYYAFDPRVEYLSPDKQIKDWSIACWGAKWLFEDEIMGARVTRQEAFDRKDSSILEPIWQLMNDAHIVVTQNGVNFDHKKLNSRFIENRIKPPAKFLKVDTYKTAKEVLGQSYNRLDELGKKFGIGKKIDMSFVDWKNCLGNDDAADVALDHMLTYCKRDIAPLLEDVYLAMLPYMENHPNMNVFSMNDDHVCPKCESTDLTWNEKNYATPQGLWSAFRCQSCGATGRGTRKEHNIKSVGIK